MSEEPLHPDRDAADSRVASPPVAKSCLQPQYSALLLRVEVRVSFVCKSEGVTVPLGYIDNGAWVAPPFVDVHTTIDCEELADWLSEDQAYGPPLAFSRLHAEAMIRDSLERCHFLASASAAHRSAQSAEPPID